MEKILIISDLLQRAYGQWAFHRLLPRIILIIGLIMTIAMFVSFSLISGLNIIYLELLSNGVTPPITALIVFFVAISVIALLLWCAMVNVRKLVSVPEITTPKNVLPANITSILNAFINGLMAEQTQK